MVHTYLPHRLWSTLLTCCTDCRRCSPGIAHSAAVSARDVPHWLGDGEHSL